MPEQLKMVVTHLIVVLLAVQQLQAERCNGCECTKILERLSVHCIGKNITSIPRNLPANTAVIHMINTGITQVENSSFQSYRALTGLYIEKNSQLTTLQSAIFKFNQNLSNIVIKDNPKLSEINNFTFHAEFRSLRKLDLSYNNLAQMPDLSELVNTETTLFYHLHLDGNPLTSPSPICYRRQKHRGSTCSFNYVTMTHTKIKHLSRDILNGTEVTMLDASNNTELVDFDPDVFSLITPGSLQKLILSDNPKLTEIPSEGISWLKVLKCQNCPEVTRVPPTILYRNIAEVHLTYPQHCCAFRKPSIQNRDAYNKVLDKAEYKCKAEQAMSSTTEVSRLGRKLFGFREMITDAYTPEVDTTTRLTIPTIDPSRNHVIDYKRNCTQIDFEEMRNALICTPAENSFRPCEDIFERDDWLRVVLWLVSISALIGNFVVLTFTISSRTKSPLTVTKFLICNLAFSDALQGVYLLTLAIVDVKTLGQYFNFATWWQKEGGCDAIGFLTVFASELSVYTLSVITLERWYAISHAIHLTKRVQMRQAVIIMAIGWLLSAVLALLPLVGVSSYEETSLCLPFRFEQIQDKVYITFLLALNIAAFCLVFLCYVSIFLQVRGSSAIMASDTHLARRMALLVFTDFICWGPVAIVAGLSAGGVDIQKSFLTDANSLFIAKVILVLFYPFNACANPFLYAIGTKQFKKDCWQTLSYCCINKNKAIAPIRRDSNMCSRNTTVRNSQSHLSNTTQLTNTTCLSLQEHTRASIRSKSSVDAFANSCPSSAAPTDLRRGSTNCVGNGVHGHRRKHTGCKHRSASHSAWARSISCSASTIDSIDSRRPSDPVRVPETLEEIDSNWHEDTPCILPPDDSDPAKTQWHRDRWLSDERNKGYSDKSTDVDSGTEVNQISESECEDCLAVNNQNSITSSCSTGGALFCRRASCSHPPRIIGLFNNYNCDSESECSCLVHSFHHKPLHSGKSRTENNNLSQPTNREQSSGIDEKDEEEAVRVPLTTADTGA